MLTANNIKKLNERVQAKELEWKSLLQEQNEYLQNELIKTSETLRLEKIRFLKLKEDFEHNLNLLQGRDEELYNYENLFQQIKANENLKNEEISNMKIKVDDADVKYKRLAKEKEELQKHYQMRLSDFQEEVNICYAKKDDEMKLQNEKNEKIKLRLQLKIQELEENTALDHQKLLGEFNNRLREKEDEFQEVLNGKETELHSQSLKVKMLTKELDILRTANNKTEETLQSNKKVSQDLHKIIKDRDYEIEDMNNMNNLKVKELEGAIAKLKKTIKEKDEDYSRKYSDFQRTSNEKEAILSKIKGAANEMEVKMRQEVKKVVKQNEELELALKRALWEKEDVLKEKQFEIQRNLEEISDLQLKLKEAQQHFNQLKVSKDLELEGIKTSEGQLREINEQLKIDLQRYKSDLSNALERERILENAKTQLELDWRRRLELKENEIHNQNEILLQNMRNSQEEVEARLQKKEEELNELENRIKILQVDKETAVKFLKKNGIEVNALFLNNSEDYIEEDTEKSVIEQNKRLKEVIQGMRKEMEGLTEQVENDSKESKELPTSYVKELEKEISNLKVMNRNLKERLHELSKDYKPPIKNVDTPIKNVDTNSLSQDEMKNHCKQLMQTVAALRHEKVQITATSKSKEATIQHLHDSMTNLESQLKQKTLAIESLNFDLNTNKNLHEETVVTLKNRISELELQLNQSRSMAETYYKSLLERNIGPIYMNRIVETNESKINTANEDVSGIAREDELINLKGKLKVAVERIKELSKERSKLINVGNRMKAELATMKNDLVPVVRVKKREEHPWSDVTFANIRNDSSTVNHHSKGTSKALENSLHSLNKIDQDEEECSEKVEEVSDFVSYGSSDEIQKVDEFQKKLVSLSPDHTNESTTSSLKEVWKLLDNDDISTIHSMRSSQSQFRGLNIKGKNIETTTRTKEDKKITSKRTVLPKVTQKKAKIRNYNVKDS